MMSGSIFDSKFHRDSLLALMLWKLTIIIRILLLLNICLSALFEAVGDDHYRPPEGGRLYDMKVVSGYAFLRTYFV